MKDILTIIWDNRGDQIAFDIVRDGKRFNDLRGTTEGAQFANDVRATAERFGGFRYINARRAFQNAFPLKGDEQARLIKAFERQGYSVRNVGAVEPMHREEIANDWTAEAKPKARPIPTPRGQRARVAVQAPAMAYGT